MRCCCNDGETSASTARDTATSLPLITTADNARVPWWNRRIRTFVQSALPLTTLALVPKCPICVAAYVLFFTGIGLSLTAATVMRGPSSLAVSLPSHTSSCASH